MNARDVIVGCQKGDGTFIGAVGADAILEALEAAGFQVVRLEQVADDPCGFAWTDSTGEWTCRARGEHSLRGWHMDEWGHIKKIEDEA